MAGHGVIETGADPIQGEVDHVLLKHVAGEVVAKAHEILDAKDGDVARDSSRPHVLGASNELTGFGIPAFLSPIRIAPNLWKSSTVVALHVSASGVATISELAIRQQACPGIGKPGLA